MSPGFIDVNAELDASTNPDELRRYSIEFATVRHPISTVYSRSVANRRVLEAAARYPSVGAVAIATMQDLDRLDAELSELVRAGVRGVWLEGRESWATESEAAKELVRAAARTGLPLLFPCRQWGDASAIGRLTEQYKAPVVLVGVHYFHYADTYAALRRFDHLHVETSALATYAAIETFVGAVGHERVLFGSGTPTRAPLAALNAVLLSSLRDEHKKAILRGNAARLFGLAEAATSLPQPRLPLEAFDVHAHVPPTPWEVPQPSNDEIYTRLARLRVFARISSSVRALLGDLEGGNADTVAVCASGRGQLGYLVVDPSEIEISRQQIRKWGGAPGIVGAKIHCVYSGKATASTAVGEMFRALADFGRPVKIHNAGADWESALTAIANENPTLPIIVAHGGPGKPSLTTAWVVTGTQNVYAELPSSLVDIREARRLAAAIPPQRLLFGTDVPLLEPAFVIGTYEDLQLEPQTLKRVYWDNAVALYGYEG